MPEAHFGVPAGAGSWVAVDHRLASAEAGYILAHSAARHLLLRDREWAGQDKRIGAA
jgi:hypothetical protein